MLSLNFPKYTFRFKNKENNIFIFDPVRKKFVFLKPEEWVRQHALKYLIEDKKYPLSLIAVERQLKYNKLSKRCDILVFNRNAKPHIIVECKAPTVKITQSSFDQIARYNLRLNATYLAVTNGLQHYYCTLDHQKQRYNFLEELPSHH